MGTDYVCEAVGRRLHRNTINLWIKSGKLPQPIRLGPKMKMWPKNELNAWLRNRRGQPA